MRPPQGAWRALTMGLMTAVVVACSGPILANPPAQRPAATPVPDASPSTPGALSPMRLPRDDAPHDRLTEWWYYTGHLRSADGGERFGFEFVIFRAERGAFPVTWASHLAVTDEGGEQFHYAQRSEIGPQVDRGTRDGFGLAIAGGPVPLPGSTPWAMQGTGGTDTIRAVSVAPETSTATPIGLDLRLGPDGPTMYHDGDGYIDFGPAGGSYYYSRPRLATSGTVSIGGREVEVEGSSWFDHQWGDFIAVGGGGWDWFAVNLADGTDLTLSLVRDRDGNHPLAYGTLNRDTTSRHLPADQFTVTVTDRWVSPRTGADYPAAWTIGVPGEGLEIGLVPTVADQELDTTATTGVVYWEGSQEVTARVDGVPVDGEAYVELTGYGAPVERP
jgi:predicted secreted hydrolase